MSSKLFVILATLGTGGDIYPFVAVGRSLMRRGHRVALITHASFEPVARQQKFHFRPVDTVETYEQFLAHPDHWHWRKNFQMSVRDFLLPNIEPVFRHIEELAQPASTVLVTHISCLGAFVACEKLRIPTALMCLSRPILPTVYDTPQYAPLHIMPPWMPKTVKRCFFRWVTRNHANALGPSINEFRMRLGLAKRRTDWHWMLGADKLLAMWPDWYGPPQPDWPEHTAQVGFVSFEPHMELDVARIPDPPPILFTGGTGVIHESSYFQFVSEACKPLNRSALVVANRFHNNGGPRLPNLHVLPSAPFRQLLPHCAAMVHHGGIGTAAQALAAGVPQVVMPRAIDQFDNARQLIRLGVARKVTYLRNTRQLTDALAALLACPRTAASCQRWKQRVYFEEAENRSAQIIEQLGRVASVD